MLGRVQGFGSARKGDPRFDSPLPLPPAPDSAGTENGSKSSLIEKLLAYLSAFRTPLNYIRFGDRFELTKPLQPELILKR